MATKKIVIPTAFDNRSSYSRSKVRDLYEKTGDTKVFKTESSFDNEGNSLFDKEVIPSENGGKEGLSLRAAMFADMETFVKQNEAIRKGNESQHTGGVEYSFAEAVSDRYGFASVNDFLRYGLDIDPSSATLHSFAQISDIPDGARWLIPEIILEMYKLGLRKDPIYGQFITRDVAVNQPKATIPFMNLSDAMPQVLGERESVILGQMSFGSKDVSLVKFGIGIEIDSETRRAVSIDLLSDFFADAGVKFNTALDALAIMTLLNGEQSDGSASAATIGVVNATSFQWLDYLRVRLRMKRLGRESMIMLAGEDTAISMLNLPEFKGTYAGNYALTGLNIMGGENQASQRVLVHGLMAADEILFVDPKAALMKLTYQGMSMESERIAREDIDVAYIRTSTGFATLMRDARVKLKTSIAYAATGLAGGFPIWMDPTSVETSIFRKRGTV